MKVDWDEQKNKANIAKHGIGFKRACTVLDGPCLTWEDERFDYGEVRVNCIGLMEGVLVTMVVYTERDDDLIRLISARKATRKERRKYEQALRRRA